MKTPLRKKRHQPFLSFSEMELSPSPFLRREFLLRRTSSSFFSGLREIDDFPLPLFFPPSIPSEFLDFFEFRPSRRSSILKSISFPLPPSLLMILSPFIPRGTSDTLFLFFLRTHGVRVLNRFFWGLWGGGVFLLFFLEF